MGRHTASKKNLDSAEIWAKLGCGNAMKLFNMCNKLYFHFLWLSVIVSYYLFVDQLIMTSESV